MIAGSNACSAHSEAGPIQKRAKAVRRTLVNILRQEVRSANDVYIRGHTIILGNEREDVLAGQVARKWRGRQTPLDSISNGKFLRYSQRPNKTRRRSPGTSGWTKSHHRPQNIVHEQRPLLYCPGCSSPQDWKLAFSSVLKTVNETSGRLLVYIREACYHVKIPSFTTLPKYRIEFGRA
jgi:hypothetical protein